MPVPQAIFIDTGILDRECYDFSSSRMLSFVAAASVVGPPPRGHG
jgi:hypothetical protein